MNSLPKEGYVRGLKWTVKRVDGNHPALVNESKSDKDVRPYYGMCDKFGYYGPELTIYVRKGLTPQVAWETLIHEFAHAIQWGFKPFDLTKEMPVEIFAGEFFGLLRQWKLL